MLYLVATPIGNLSDLTYRAVEVLSQADYILCEDTRHSRRLLGHYQINRPLRSYHQFNEASREEEVVADLKQGKQIALISDAGTPGISDPGERLVARCREAGLDVTALPGPCAAVLALTLSGLSTEPFQFVGFLPKKQGALKQALAAILGYVGSSICYESPKRLLKTLELLGELAPERPLAVARELTKCFEEVLRGTARELLDHWGATPVKGEIVLLVGPGKEESQAWQELSLKEQLAWAEETMGLSRNEAIKWIAAQQGVPKREIYNQLH